jgi:hypothetical protein
MKSNAQIDMVLVISLSFDESAPEVQKTFCWQHEKKQKQFFIQGP